MKKRAYLCLIKWLTISETYKIFYNNSYKANASRECTEAKETGISTRG
jgi:hypothetical protein